MARVLLVGNPNVGKSTLFNSLTKSSEHTGNFHGVTVEAKRKTIEFANTLYTFVDLPGLYSLTAFSYEEEVARDELMSAGDIRLVILDANTIRKNLYLCVEMMELGLDFRLLINNYDYFSRRGNYIDIKRLSTILGLDVELINAKKVKLNKSLLTAPKKANTPKYIEPFVIRLSERFGLDRKTAIQALNGIYNNLTPEQIEYVKLQIEELILVRYNYIDSVLNSSLHINENYIYGYSKLDKVLLNPIVMSVGFLAIFLGGIYLIFFSLGAHLSEALVNLYEWCIVSPIMDLIVRVSDNIWIIEFCSGGVLSSVGTVLGFLPQIVLLFIFLTLLEDSGIISRMSFVFDDFLSMFGLNGKAIYVMLMGLGCNTMSCMASRNMGENNLKIKSAILNPYISCMARLPVYVVIASAFFGMRSYFVIVGLYLLGLVVALIMSLILSKTILSNEKNSLLLEFAPLRKPDIKHILVVAKKNTLDMMKRIFSVVLCMGVIVWILSHTGFNLRYCTDFMSSIMYGIARIISPIFAPIGLGNSGIVSALIVGIMAKELILSTMAICNNVMTNTALSASLIATTSVISLSPASAISMLIFTLLYCPCVSNIAVLRQETNRFYMWFAIISQFTIAYMLSFIAYQVMTKGLGIAMITIMIIAIIMFAVIFVIRCIRNRKCLSCSHCKYKNR